MREKGHVLFNQHPSILKGLLTPWQTIVFLAFLAFPFASWVEQRYVPCHRYFYSNQDDASNIETNRSSDKDQPLSKNKK